MVRNGKELRPFVFFLICLFLTGVIAYYFGRERMKKKQFQDVRMKCEKELKQVQDSLKAHELKDLNEMILKRF